MLKTKIKYIQTLGQKKFRESEGVFIAEGPKVVEELMHAIPSKIREVYALESWTNVHGDRVGAAIVSTINDWELEKISQLTTPNQVLAVIEQFDDVPEISTTGVITIALDTIQDPGNLGTIIRIADWFGIRQIVCSTGCADRYHPKVVQSTMGSIARVNMLYTDLAAWLTEQHSRIYIASLEGEDITKMDRIEEGILVIGNESKGVSEKVMDLPSTRITIPKKGGAESLNAAIAAGIILSHLT